MVTICRNKDISIWNVSAKTAAIDNVGWILEREPIHIFKLKQQENNKLSLILGSANIFIVTFHKCQ